MTKIRIAAGWMLLLAILSLACYAGVRMTIDILFPEQEEADTSGAAMNRYHGADAIAMGWEGQMTAYAWDEKRRRYRVMWRRGRSWK